MACGPSVARDASYAKKKKINVDLGAGKGIVGPSKAHKAPRETPNPNPPNTTMSTHAAIIARTPKGDYRGIYVHHDGYPSHTGQILKAHYAIDEAVTELIELGDLSSIGSTSKDCTAYHRDKGEAKRISASNDLAWVAKKIEHDYAYLWEDGEWHAFTARALQEELLERLAWEVERAESEAGWDPNP